jgi:hypothetical protein
MEFFDIVMKRGWSDATTNIGLNGQLTLQLASKTPSNGMIFRVFLAHSIFPHPNYSSFVFYHSAIKATMRLERLAES